MIKNQVLKGVRLENGKWRAQIRMNGKNVHIGFFNTLEQAQAVRQRVAAENFGDFLNVENHLLSIST